MNYVVSCLTSLYDLPLPGSHAIPSIPGLRPLLPGLMQTLDALPVEILEEQENDGFTSVLIKCDAATAAVIAERWHVSEI